VVWPGDVPERRREIVLPSWPLPVPAPREKELLEVLVREDGTLFLGGKEVDIRTLTMKLLIHAEFARDLKHPYQPSSSPVLYHASKDVRWREVQWVMQAAADPDVRIWRLYFAMRTDDGKFAYVPLFLPTDRGALADLGCITVELKRRKDETVTRIKLLDDEIGAGEIGFRVLRQRIAQLSKARPEKLCGEINAWAWTPYGDVTKALAAFRAAKIENVLFIGAPPPGRKGK